MLGKMCVFDFDVLTLQGREFQTDMQHKKKSPSDCMCTEGRQRKNQKKSVTGNLVCTL